MPPRAASSLSTQGTVAASLDHYGEEEGNGPFHQFHTCRVQLGSPRKEGEAAPYQVVCSSPSKGSKVDPLWQTTKWLKSCEGKYEDDELIWWPLVCLLTNGSNMATLGLAQQLMAAWRWAVTVSTPPACSPTPTIINIGQFLEGDTTGCGWGVQQWLEAYTHVLQ